ncbi:receptor-type guanylate cyclase gcy-22-like, partial [Acanthaster planci]|uniref:Receptor-type guanylate cyclase gcy-22-like n=1 Tax=Acanthaster planci TaxID=133434 RepID=A0A8B7Z9U4_ACAPL
RICSESTPLQVVEMLNNVYTNFDSRIDKYDVYKVETIGDAYMVVSGLPQRNGNKHASEIACMALDLQKCIEELVIPHKPGTKMTLRIGMHTGPVVAGIVGSKMPRYCLFGESVNIAAKMESNGLPNRIQVSEDCAHILTIINSFSMAKRGEMLIKGRGTMITYWLLGCVQDADGNGFNTNRQDLNLHVPELPHPAILDSD